MTKPQKKEKAKPPQTAHHTIKLDAAHTCAAAAARAHKNACSAAPRRCGFAVSARCSGANAASSALRLPDAAEAAKDEVEDEPCERGVTAAHADDAASDADRRRDKSP